MIEFGNEFYGIEVGWEERLWVSGYLQAAVSLPVGAIDLYLAGQRRIVLVDHQGYPDLVGEHERGLVRLH